jgi:hypothetical protein
MDLDLDAEFEQGDDDNKSLDLEHGLDDQEQDELEDDRDGDAACACPPGLSSTASKKRSDKYKDAVKGAYSYTPTSCLAADNQLMPEPEAVTIPYRLNLFSLSVMKSLQLNSDEPYNTLKAQVLAKISTSLNPKTLDFQHYTVLYNIPHVVSKPGIPIPDESAYNFMIKRILKIKNLNTVSLHIESKVPEDESDKENNKDTEEEGTSKKKKKKKLASKVLSLFVTF